MTHAGIRRALSVVFGIAAATMGVRAAQAASVAEIFQKYNLVGTFAWDCGKPASGANFYFVNRIVGANVQRDIMDGPSSRRYVTIIDNASEASSNQIAVSGTMDGNKPVTGAWRIEGARMVPMEATESGRKTVADGKIVASGNDVPWLNRCN